MEEAILSEDNHVRAGDLSIIFVKMGYKWVWSPRIGEGEQAYLQVPLKKEEKKKYVHENSFHLNLLFVLVSEITGRESLDRDML